MIEHNISVVDITIGANMYGRISDLPNTPSHVLAEFVDNALQSSRDKKEQLLALDVNYRLRVDIDFEWDENTNQATVITVTDNAGGIDADNYTKAFKLANTPDNNEGLNEFGMGLKTAALWLGNEWNVKTSAFGETVSRSITFDLNKVLADSLTKLVVKAEEAEATEHYTTIRIASPTPKSPTKKALDKIRTELSSIYRKSLRQNEADIYVDGVKLTFEESEILTAPSVKDPKGPAIYWRKDIDFKFGKYRATGFIGILKDINSTKNGFVLLRRGRVVYGAETDGRYFPKSLSGSTGTFRYKRIFGELELEGFAVSFNKNDLQDKENLEALMEMLRGEIHTKEFDLYNQAEDYRLDERQKKVKKLVKSHNNDKKKNEKIEVVTKPQPVTTTTTYTPDTTSQLSIVSEPNADTPLVMGHFDDTYNINGKDYKLRVEMVDKGNELVWLDTMQQDENVVTCKINMNHVFFQHFQNSEKAIVAILKTMALAKFMAKEEGNDSTAELFDSFNAYIKKTKV